MSMRSVRRFYNSSKGRLSKKCFEVMNFFVENSTCSIRIFEIKELGLNEKSLKQILLDETIFTLELKEYAQHRYFRIVPRDSPETAKTVSTNLLPCRIPEDAIKSFCAHSHRCYLRDKCQKAKPRQQRFSNITINNWQILPSDQTVKIKKVS